MTAINKFNKSMIYSIRSPATERYYIGSTTQILCKRFSDHNINYKAYLKGTGCFITSFKILELGNAYIELLEEVNCENRNQLEKREGELIREHKDLSVNKIIVGRTQKEYKTDNPEQQKQSCKKYMINNKDKLIQYRIDNKDKIIQYRIDNKDKIIQYRIDNKESLSKRHNKYYKDNIESIKAKTKLLHLCECGSAFTMGNKARHIKTAKHLKALEQEIIIV